MKDELQEILTDFDEQISRYEQKIDTLNASLSFCNDHKFLEEARIIRLKLESIDILTFRFRGMYKKVKEVVDNWPTNPSAEPDTATS